MPFIGLLELFGVLAASYHLSYGLFRVGARHGLDGHRLRVACAGLGSVAGIVAAVIVLRLATG
jgi:hypothetical protein